MTMFKYVHLLLQRRLSLIKLDQTRAEHDEMIWLDVKLRRIAKLKGWVRS